MSGSLVGSGPVVDERVVVLSSCSDDNRSSAECAIEFEEVAEPVPFDGWPIRGGADHMDSEG